MPRGQGSKLPYWPPAPRRQAQRPELRALLGTVARQFAEDHLAEEAVLGRLEGQMRALVGP